MKKKITFVIVLVVAGLCGFLQSKPIPKEDAAREHLLSLGYHVLEMEKSQHFPEMDEDGSRRYKEPFTVFCFRVVTPEGKEGWVTGQYTKKVEVEVGASGTPTPSPTKAASPSATITPTKKPTPTLTPKPTATPTP